MKSLYRLKKDKMLFVIVILCAVILAISLLTLLANIIQVAVVATNSTKVWGAILALNITSIVLSAAAMIGIYVYIKVRKI